MEGIKAPEEVITKDNYPTAKVKITKGDTEGYDRNMYNYMERKLNLKGTELYSMKAAKIPAKVNGAWATIFRFFNNDEVVKQGLTINDFESLNEHPEMILYEGYHVIGKDGEIVVKKRDGIGTSFLEEKIKKGEISEIGIKKEKTRSQKFLSGFAHFLMYGGFLVVIIVIVGIIILISMLTK